MIEETNLEECKKIAIKLLYAKTKDVSENIIIGSNYTLGRRKNIDLRKNSTKLKEVRQRKEYKINNVKEYKDFFDIVGFYKKLEFIFNTKQYVSKKDYSKFLSYIYNYKNYYDRYYEIYSYKLLDYIREADKHYLIKPFEVEEYSKFDDTIIVYKALEGIDDRKNIQCMTWDFDIEIAKKYANKSKPYIYKAKIKKDNCYMFYYNRDDTKGLIIDYTKLYDIELVEEMIFIELDELALRKKRVVSYAIEEIDKIMNVTLSICDKEVKQNSDMLLKGEEKRLEVEKNNTYLKEKVKDLNKLRVKVSNRKRKAIKYLIDRCSHPVFKQLAYSECLKHINLNYQKQIRCVNESIYVYTKALMKNEQEMKKLRL